MYCQQLTPPARVNPLASGAAEREVTQSENQKEHKKSETFLKLQLLSGFRGAD